MIKKIGLCVLLVASVSFLPAKELKYPVSDIPAILKENAHTVMRVHKYELEIKSEKQALATITEVRTILNKNGEQNADFMEMYSPMNKIVNLKGKVYDAAGKQVRNFGADDIIDRSYISGSSIYDDSRLKIIDAKYLTYPFTVEYTYQVELKQTFNLPNWSHSPTGTSYENSSLVVRVPQGYAFRYKEYNLKKGVAKSEEKGKDAYTWELSNLGARIHEPMAANETPAYPLVILAPNKFFVGDTNGSAETWKDLGIWATSLIRDKDKLPAETAVKIKQITSDCSNDLEKVKKVYEYMQQKTRYVSIQVGVGGWMPFDAATVDKFSYGDCKALTNYTKALLGSVGVTSYYTLVKAGPADNYIDESFPANQFNHIILCVPVQNDTLWLECTNQRLPAGYNGDFTDNRLVLLVDGENSKLVRTRAFPAEENCVARNSLVKFGSDGVGNASVKTKYVGLRYEDILPVYYADDASKLKMVTQRIALPSFKLSDFSYVENRGYTPSFDESLNLAVNNYIRELTGNVALLPLNFMNKLNTLPDKVRNRKTDMCIRRPLLEKDTAVYQLPAGYQITELPPASDIVSRFGKYHAIASQEGNVVSYKRHFELYKGTFPATAYAEFREFLEQVSAADDAVAVLKKL